MIKSTFYLYWKSIFITCVILYLSFAQPSTFKSIPVFSFADKIVHFLIYAFYALVLIYDYQKDVRINASKSYFLLICLMFPSILGGIIELIQERFFAPRSAELFDWLLDILGVVTGILISKLVLKKK